MLSAPKSAKIIKIAVCLFIMSAAVFLLSDFVLAAADVGLEYPAGTGLSNSQDIRIIIAKIIRVIIGFLGVIALGLIMFAGWLWMSSEGNEEKIEQAKKMLTNAVIGLVIILASFAIASFILNSLMGTAGNYTSQNAVNDNRGGGIFALGSGIISSHYPERNQKEVPRNTKIVVSFKEPIDPATIMAGETINKNNIKIYKTSDGAANAVTFDVKASKTEDNKTFVFRPTQYLGSPTEKVWYSVALGKNIKKANGDAAFGGVLGDLAYDWMFEVGTMIDNAPPRILSVIPRPATTEPRNVVIQINFSEAVDPISSSGAFKSGAGFNNISVTDSAGGSAVEGTFYISNQYKTTEFLTFNACGINSCGNTIYCLPGDKQLKVLAKAAGLAAGGAGVIFPYTGVVDMADNSLDGNGDGSSQGPQSQSNLPPFNAGNSEHAGEGDDYFWLFNTNNTIDVTPPVVNRVEPPVGGNGVDLSAVPQATFSKLLMSSTLNSSSVNFKSNGSGYNYWITKTDDSGAKQTTAKINHDQFNENGSFAIQLNSGIKDIYQNCYTPCSGLGVAGSPSCCDGRASNNSSCQ